jgi:hypothetical protein
MARRRVLLKTGLASTLLPLLPILPARATEQRQMRTVAPVRAAQRFDAVLYDARHVRARAYGRALRRSSAVVHAMHGDPTAAWLELLDPLWRSGPASVAGMTSPSALFCIEQMAHGHGMRVTARSTVAANQTLVAWVIGPVRQQEV